MQDVCAPDGIAFKPGIAGSPPTSVEQAELFSAPSEPVLHLTLLKWHPGSMSAPHWCETDLLCIVVLGTWRVASGDASDPAATVPAGPGSVARTTHDDGVSTDGTEPALIAIGGLGPITLHAVEPSKPTTRKV